MNQSQLVIAEIQALFEKQAYDLVLEKAKLAIQNPDTRIYATYFKVRVLQSKAEWNAALLDLNFALALHPNAAILLGERGVIHIQLNAWNAAMQDLELALTIEPTNPYRHSSLAWLKGRLGDITGAVEAYKKAIALDPTDMVAYNNLGLLEEQLGKKELAEARYQYADKLAGRMPTDWDQISQEVDAFNKRNKPIDAANSTEEEPSLEKPLYNNKWQVIKAIFLNRSLRKEFFGFLFGKKR